MIEALPSFGRGLVVTVELAIVSVLASLVLGVAIGLLAASSNRAVRAVGTVYVETFRNLPPLLLLFVAFFALPRVGVILDQFPCAVLALGIYGAAFVAEAARGGVLSVRPAHVEAARALGMGPLAVVRHVILPLALVAALPSLTNLAIAILKATSLAGAIGIDDTMAQTKAVQVQSFRIFEAFGIAMAIYVALVTPLTLASQVLERRHARVLGD